MASSCRSPGFFYLETPVLSRRADCEWQIGDRSRRRRRLRGGNCQRGRVSDLSRAAVAHGATGRGDITKSAAPFDRDRPADRRNERGEISRTGAFRHPGNQPPRETGSRRGRERPLPQGAHARARAAPGRRSAIACAAKRALARGIEHASARGRSVRRGKDRSQKQAASRQGVGDFRANQRAGIRAAGAVESRTERERPAYSFSASGPIFTPGSTSGSRRCSALV